MGHTPEPWVVSGYHRAILEEKRSIDGCSLTIANMPICMGPGFEKGYNEANARLIAASPTLLEALKRCQVRVFMSDGCSEEYELAKAAIAAAETL